MGKKPKKKTSHGSDHAVVNESIDAENSSEHVETRGQMLQRHKLELRGHAAKVKEAKKKKKDERKILEEELAQLEQQMKANHLSELEAHQVVEEEHSENIVEQKDPIEGKAIINSKIAKAQRRRERKKQEEKERELQLEEANANIVSDRQIELEAILMKLKMHNCNIKEIPADGHCMYHAVADQLQLHNITDDNDNKMTYCELRRITSRHLLDHRDDFMPFVVVDFDSSSDPQEAYNAYCDRVKNSADWGGHVELRALSTALKIPIEVTSADSDRLYIGEEFPGQALNLTYHLHYYALGEHFNSVHPQSRSEEINKH